MLLVLVPEVACSSAGDASNSSTLSSSSQSANGRAAGRAYAHPLGRRHVPFVTDVALIGGTIILMPAMHQGKGRGRAARQQSNRKDRAQNALSHTQSPSFTY
jgi:hypothetical protein